MVGGVRAGLVKLVKVLVLELGKKEHWRLRVVGEGGGGDGRKEAVESLVEADLRSDKAAMGWR